MGNPLPAAGQLDIAVGRFVRSRLGPAHLPALHPHWVFLNKSGSTPWLDYENQKNKETHDAVCFLIDARGFFFGCGIWWYLHCCGRRPRRAARAPRARASRALGMEEDVEKWRENLIEKAVEQDEEAGGGGFWEVFPRARRNFVSGWKSRFVYCFFQEEAFFSLREVVILF